MGIAAGYPGPQTPDPNLHPRFEVDKPKDNLYHVYDTVNDKSYTVNSDNISQFALTFLKDNKDKLSASELREFDQTFTDITKHLPEKFDRVVTSIHLLIQASIKNEEIRNKEAQQLEFHKMLPNASADLKSEFSKLHPAERELFLDRVAKLYSKKSPPDEASVIELAKNIAQNKANLIKSKAKTASFSETAKQKTYNVYESPTKVEGRIERTVKTKQDRGISPKEADYGALRKEITYNIPKGPLTERKCEEFFMDLFTGMYGEQTSKTDKKVVEGMKFAFYTALQEVTTQVEQGSLEPEKAVSELRKNLSRQFGIEMFDQNAPEKQSRQIISYVKHKNVREKVNAIFEDTNFQKAFVEFFCSVQEKPKDKPQ